MTKSLSVEDSKIIEKYIKKFIGKKNNPLNGLKFKEILKLAKQESKKEMKNFEVLDIFRFDFSDRFRSKKILQKLFNKYGFYLLKVDLTNDYNNIWSVVNKNDNSIINTSYKSSYVLFYKENDIIHVAFDYKIKFDTSNNYYMTNNFVIRG